MNSVDQFDISMTTRCRNNEGCIIPSDLDKIVPRYVCERNLAKTSGLESILITTGVFIEMAARMLNE